MSKKPTREEIAQRCARRLTIARVRAGFPRPTDAIEEHGFPRRAYFAHEAGKRVPEPERRKRYAEAFGVSDKWLAGQGDDEVNQLNQNDTILDISPSQTAAVRRIPILSGNDIRKFADGEGVRVMATQDIPVPAQLNLSADSFGYEIPANDVSMMYGEGGQSFPPGSMLIIDRQAEIIPGSYVIADVEGFEQLIVRRYIASLPNMTTGYELEAINPAFKPLTVRDTKCRILGRAVWTMTRL